MARRGRPRHPDILTPREWDVLALLRERATNEQIASRLGITERTAKFHVSEILGKLGVSSREEAAAWQPEERRPWWLAAAAPFSFARRTAGGGLNAIGLAAGAAVLAAAIAGIALLSIMLARGGAGTPPAAGSLIAFSAGGSIYTVRPDGSELTKIIAGDRQSTWNAALSPDGSRIAFTRDYNIWIANSDGSGAHELAAVRDLQTPPDNAASNFSTGAQSLAWSPDGKHMAYVLGRIGGSGIQDIWIMRSDGSERTEIYQGGAFWIQPVWLDNDRVAVVAPGKILVFNRTGDGEPAITFLDALQQFSLAAIPALPIGEDEWLVGPIATEGPITLGSADAGRKTVATGVAPALAPGGAAFAYFAGDTLRIAEIGGSADEQILDLAPLGGRDRFFGEAGLCFNTSSAVAPPACSYRLPEISWVGSAEANAAYIPAKAYRDDGLGIELKYPGAWIEGATDKPIAYKPCTGGFDAEVNSGVIGTPGCAVFGPPGADPPFGVEVFSPNFEEPQCIDGNMWRCNVVYASIDAREVRALQIADRAGRSVEALRNPPVPLANTDRNIGLYHEIWTAMPLGNRGLFFVAFWRDGDTVAEQETRAGYDVVLKSLSIRPQQ